MGVLRIVNGVHRMTDELFNTTTLTASTTAVASPFTFAHATYGGMIIKYKIKESTTNETRTGHIYVATKSSGTPSVADSYTETSNIGVSWVADINGANVELSYTTTANSKIMKYSFTMIPA
jgi:hypothetical protein